ncbi:hypothetical protein GpartN1_g5759.t1 [Galdieria partita]|uniref:Protein SEY1 homolog n=1 Tax=Galdieria partita TaxID=83374 RepID=A0A9C7Q041_9RHOD|nr:hypothetical protein GpartN1_g5759.t1 [Galdieria partita]
MARVESLTTEDYRQSLENGFIQLVNYEEEFNSQVSQFIRDVGLYNADLDYHVVAVMGCQSSGKSTLLNLLFGTQFRTMDANTGRYQVTQGIWLSKDKDFPILVLDLEGTDSRERGEEAASFERKSTLFALAVADVLIVNMWAQDVGRYVAANLALLRTVLELNLQLFQNDREHRKTKLLFVLRDHVETSLDLLAKTIRTDLEETWKGLQKPSQFENSTVENFFELRFVSLPHMVLKPEEFKAAVTDLKNQFHKKGNSPDSMFPESYRRLVAADGFTTYANNIWETIRSNKEVDIPSQREMLATVRCEEIADEVYWNAHHKFQEWNEILDMLKRNSKDNFEHLKEKLIHDLGDQSWQVMMEAIDAYNNGTKRYISNVSEAKKVKLQERMEAEAKELYLRQLSLVEEHGLLFLEKELEHLASRATPWLNFQTQVSKLLEKVWKTLRDIASCSLEDAKLLFKEVRQFKEEEFEQREQKLVERVRRNVVDKTTQLFVEKTGAKFRNLFIATLENNPQDIWQSLNRPLSSTISESLKELSTCLNEICVDEDVKISIFRNTMEKFKEEIELRAKDLLSSNSVTMSYLCRKFDSCFRKDSRGVPRVWKPGDDLDSLYLDAKQETQSLLMTLSEAKLIITFEENLREEMAIENFSELLDSLEIIFEIFSVERRNALEEKLEDYAKLAYTEAKRSQETIHTRSQIPGWLYVALFVLGFNEMKMVLRNPLLLLSMLLILPVLYILVQANLHHMLLSMILSKMEQYLPESFNLLQRRMHSAAFMETTPSGINLQSSFDSPIPNRIRGNETAKTTGIRLRKPNHFSEDTVTRRRRNSAGSE